MKYPLSLLVLLLHLLAVNANEGRFILQAPREAYTTLNQHLLVLEDSTGNLTFTDIKDKSFNQAFRPYNNIKGQFNANHWYWGKIRLTNQTRHPFTGILYLGGKRDADFADLYKIGPTGHHVHERAGYLVPASEKSVITDLGAKFRLHLMPGESKMLYMRIHNTTGFKPDFQLELQSNKTFHQNITSRNWVQGIIHGSLWLMLLYNLLLFIMSRNRVYLYYCLYIFGVAVNFLTEKGIFLENILKNTPVFNDYLFVIATGILSIFYIQFFRSFLDTKQMMPKWDIVHKTVIGIKGAEMVVLLLLMLISYSVPAMITISNISNLLLLGYGMAFIYGLLKYSRNRLAYYFTVATFSLVAGTFISLYYLMFDTSLGFDPKYFMNAGTIGELLFFSLGLGYKIRKNEEDKRLAQEKLINQLKRNEELQQKVNRELEGKVQERTREISQQKEEISAQSEKMAEINKELEKLSVVASETDNAVMIMDGNGKIEWVNKGLKRMFGFNMEELLQRGNSIFDILEITNFKTIYERAKKEKASVSQEMLYKRKDGNDVWVQTTLTPIMEDDNEIHKLIGIGSDISKIKEAEHKISRQNKQITASINYAKRIQTAIMPDHDILQNHFKDFFIYFQPRDIVSGDFYWFKQINKYVVIVAADCTGHGVPGAFMSMLSVAYLNEVVHTDSVPHANEILEELRKQIKISLHQTGSNFQSKDGIDIAFNVYDSETRKLYFSGAHSPLYIMKNGQIHIYKGDRMPVGKSRKERPFTIHEIDLEEGDIIYLFSDGYIDQFEKHNKEKYKAVRFRELLSEIHTKQMDEQKAKIQQTFKDWKGETPQLDDVLVMGIKV